MEESTGISIRTTFHNTGSLLWLSGTRKIKCDLSRNGPSCLDTRGSCNINQNDNGFMEKKKIDKRFYLLSAINLIPVLILGDGLTINSLILAGALVILVINHTLLVKVVQAVTKPEPGAGMGKSMGRIFVPLMLKFFMLFGLVGLIYVYKVELLTKLFLIIFFQLIIQVVSIKNNYQNS